MTCIAMQPLITSCCYEGMRMLHAVRPAQRRRPRDGAAGIRPAPEGRRFKEAAAAHPAATRQGTVVGWPPRRCGKMAGQAFLWLLYFIWTPKKGTKGATCCPFHQHTTAMEISGSTTTQPSTTPSSSPLQFHIPDTAPDSTAQPTNLLEAQRDAINETEGTSEILRMEKFEFVGFVAAATLETAPEQVCGVCVCLTHPRR